MRVLLPRLQCLFINYEIRANMHRYDQCRHIQSINDFTVYHPQTQKVKRAKVKVTRTINAVTDNAPYAGRAFRIFLQEGWLSPTERASVSAISTLFGSSRESRRYVVAFSRLAGAGIGESKAHFGLPWVRPWDNRRKCYMDGKSIQCLPNASQNVPIYLQPFTSYSEILVGNCNFFLPLAFNGIREKVWFS